MASLLTEKQASVILIHQKGVREDRKNYTKTDESNLNFWKDYGEGPTEYYWKYLKNNAIFNTGLQRKSPL